MEQYFPGSVLLKQYNGYLIFKVLPEHKVSEIFEIVQKMEKELQIVDVAITNSSLEDVFMNVVKNHEDEKNPESGMTENQDKVADDVFVSFPTAQEKSFRPMDPNAPDIN